MSADAAGSGDGAPPASPPQVPIYVVSLARDAERRQALAARMPRHAAAWSWIEAVDGRALDAATVAQRSAAFSRRYQRLPAPAELGCWLSHAAARARLRAEPAAVRHALVLEDDVLGTDDHLDRAQSLAWALSDRSVTILGGQQGHTAPWRLHGYRTATPGHYAVAAYSRPFVYGTCCYLLGRGAADHIDALAAGVTWVADAWDDLLAGSDIGFYYADILAHPVDLRASHIEDARRRLEPPLWRKVLGPRLTKMARQRVADWRFRFDPPPGLVPLPIRRGDDG